VSITGERRGHRCTSKCARQT